MYDAYACTLGIEVCGGASVARRHTKFFVFSLANQSSMSCCTARQRPMTCLPARATSASSYRGGAFVGGSNNRRICGGDWRSQSLARLRTFPELLPAMPAPGIFFRRNTSIARDLRQVLTSWGQGEFGARRQGTTNEKTYTGSFAALRMTVVEGLVAAARSRALGRRRQEITKQRPHPMWGAASVLKQIRTA